ncbi:group III truncated hemoglobin [Microvirga brassicacearum]|uniref:group III truncated hemoglobin n=1 Tax=Microvirga brassicacearum TaxID=2580413 RepID=UPI0030842691
MRTANDTTCDLKDAQHPLSISVVEVTKEINIPLIDPASGITEDLIQRLVHTFYDRVLQDDDLGPIFRGALSLRWDAHLATMVDFWSSIALRTGRYGGRPQLTHRGLGLKTHHFQRWLALFASTAQDVCEPEAASFFIDRAHRIADSWQIGLNIGPKSLRLPSEQNPL